MATNNCHEFVIILLLEGGMNSMPPIPPWIRHEVMIMSVNARVVLHLSIMI